MHITDQVLFQLMHSHQKLAEAEYNRNPGCNNTHFSHIAEEAVAEDLSNEAITEYFKYLHKMEG